MMAIHPNCLWLVDQNGFIIFYNLESKQFETLPSNQIDSQSDILFKALASCKQSLYAVSCDHRLYIYVFSTTNKIVQDYEFWENQRWNFVSGFTNSLLPTDRPPFSNYEGTKSTPKESFVLPSSSWQWKSDWIIDEWQYSPDFSLEKQFSTEKNMISMVRKRRYHRTAYYAKFDQWVELESISDDKYQDPILDVAIGGEDSKKALSVWIVTISGRLYFRENVNLIQPEGTRWIEVSFSEVLINSSDSNCSDNEQEDSDGQQELKIEEISRVAVGSSGSVWCLTSCGRCLVRLGIRANNPIGTCWQLVEPPFGSELVQISVGQDSVWAVDRKNELWFRSGIRSSHSSSNLVCAIGSNWLKMTNEMSNVSVNCFDQCFAISVDKKNLYFRMGVEPGQLSGKMWKLIAKIQDSELSIKENESESGSLMDLTIKSDTDKLSSNGDFISNSSSVAYLANQSTNQWRCVSASTCLIINDQFFKTNNYLFQKKNMLKTESIYEDLPSGSIDSNSSASMDNNWKNSIVNQLVERFENEMSPFRGKYSKAVENGTWVKSATVMYMSNESKIQHLNDLDLNNASTLQNNIVNQVNSYLYTSNIGGTYCKSDFIKAHLELDRDGTSAESSFSTESGTLTFRFPSEIRRGKTTYKTNVVNLAEIICITSTANIINFPYSNVLFIYLSKHMFIFTFEDEKELNDWTATLNIACNSLNNLTETVFSPLYKPIVFLISLSGQAYAGYLLSDRSIQIKRNKIKAKLDQLQQSERNLKYKLHKFKEQPGQASRLNEDGETEQSTEQILNEIQEEESKLKKMLDELMLKASHSSDQNDKIFFRHLGGGNFKQIEFTATGVCWALTENGTALVHSNRVGGSIYKNLLPNNEINFISDTILFTSYENQRWLPIQGFTNQLLPTDRPQWSDESGLVELIRDQIKLPSAEWKWCQKSWEYICDTQTDSDGFEYAIDFQLTFHSQKKISDLVRRRKWCRLAKLETTGPFSQLNDESPICLKSIAMYEANFNDEDNKKSQIILWAITIDGIAVVRKNCSVENAKGTSWEYIDCRTSLTSVSISGQLIKGQDDNDDYFIQIWAVGEDGLGYLRHNCTFENPSGTLWFTIEMPGNNPINKLMACPSNCFMLDCKQNFYFRDRIKLQFPEGLAFLKLKNVKFKILNASFPSNDCNKFWAVVEVLDKQNRNLVLVVCQNYSNKYNLTENYEFKWKPYIKNAFKFVSCC